ncbi:MAG: ADP-ribosylglycohydrolase family protein [Clostridia bacterium]|nr:ADP-ribosylglycohydrolase family protein [Clostridia bacterium]
MFGAILGDIIGSPYEFDHNNIKTKDFPLFSRNSQFTDDTVMTIAIAEAVLNADGDLDDLADEAVASMQKLGRLYPYAGYGARFVGWVHGDNPKPYNSLGNGAAMRVSPVAWAFADMETVRKAARAVTAVTHNHPEGIKGAEATAAAIFMARKGASKAEIKAYIESEFGYDLSRTCDEIRPDYRHDETCMRTVPEAFAAFLEGESFEDVIRNAVSLGGDSDTLTAIAGSIAEGFYGIDHKLKAEAVKRLDGFLEDILGDFVMKYMRGL